MTRFAAAVSVAVLTLTSAAGSAAVLILGGQVSAPPATPRPVSDAMTLPAEPHTVPVLVASPALARASRGTVRVPAPSTSPVRSSHQHGGPSARPSPAVRVVRDHTRTAGARRAMWDRLVACEAPDRGWRYGAPGVGIDPGYPFEGGINATAQTWKEFGGWEFARYAWNATPEQQIVVAERILKAQGWRAWPTCSRKLGFR